MANGIRGEKVYNTSLVARFMGPTWGPPGSCRPQVGPHVGLMKLAIWGVSHCTLCDVMGVQLLVDSLSELLASRVNRRSNFCERSGHLT